jgi:hypothetical protein
MRAVPSTAHSYMVFHLANSANIVDKNSLIVTINEEISYGTAEGGETAYTWASTGHKFVPADYEDRIQVLEDEINEHSTNLEDIKEILKKDTNSEDILMYLSPEGSDENDGLSANLPKKTVKACLEAGANKISAKRGIYNEVISLANMASFEIFPTDNDKTYTSSEKRGAIVFDTSDTIEV